MRGLKVVAAVALGVLAGGCLHERVAWPPAAGDIARINEKAEANNDWLRVEYVEPIATAAGARVEHPIGIESIGVDRIALRTREGAVRELPMAMVKGVTVKERARGAAVGAGIGFASAAAAYGLVYLFATQVFPHEPGQSNWACDGRCVGTRIVPVVLGAAAVGAIVGYLTGARRTFELGPAL